PPEFMEAKLLQAIGNLMRYRSVWRFISWLFGGSARRSAPLEGSFAAKVGGHAVPISVTLDLHCSRVVLRLSPESLAASAACDALESLLSHIPTEPLQEFPDEELQ
ncbi:MAG TPA: hypothetical protein VMG10_27880, partial [Gemmataceae bacterium]|nr:hypothetical protein [Gemmataceae bacterium]